MYKYKIVTQCLYLSSISSYNFTENVQKKKKSKLLYSLFFSALPLGLEPRTL